MEKVHEALEMTLLEILIIVHHLILIMKKNEGPTDSINNSTGGAEKIFSIKFNKAKIDFAQSYITRMMKVTCL